MTVLFRSWLWRVMTLSALFGYLGVTGWHLRPQITLLENRVNGGQVAFETDRRAVLFPWGCVTASWSVEGIEAVFFDDDAAVGQESRQHCPATATYPAPTLYIDFQGNFIQTFSVPLTVLTAARWFQWSSGLVFLALLLTALPFIQRTPTEAVARPSVGVSRRQAITGLGAGVALSGLAWGGWTLAGPLSESGTMTTTDGWLLRDGEAR
ncbi:MAG: hypothetical protein AAF125_22205 [Chloroflexota bacterium]